LAYEGQIGSVQSNDKDIEEEDSESVKEAKPKRSRLGSRRPVDRRSLISCTAKSKSKEEVSKAGSQQMWLSIILTVMFRLSSV
jgi:hypothetical protein